MPANRKTMSPSRTFDETWCVDRRDFLKASAASLFGLMLGPARTNAGPSAPGPSFRFGLVTDSHYADADPKGTRYYRESLGKMREAVGRLRSEHVEFAAHLGDNKDMAPGEPEARTLANLVAIEREFQRFGGPTFHVLGNHDMDNLSKRQVRQKITNTGVAADRSYYAFSHSGVRFIVIDTNFTKDGRDYDHGHFDWRDIFLPPVELAWLRTELKSAAEPVVVFGHQRLDGDGDLQVINRVEVREVLESSGKVLAVFQGHDHKGGYTLINGIHYYTLRAMVEGSGAESNAYAVVDVHPTLDLTLTGFRRAVTMELGRRPAIFAGR